MLVLLSTTTPATAAVVVERKVDCNGSRGRLVLVVFDHSLFGLVMMQQVAPSPTKQ